MEDLLLPLNVLALGTYERIAVTERIDVSLDRIRSIIDELPADGFSTGDVIRAYSGVFCSNLNTPAYYSFNAQFGKLLRRNESNLGIKQIAESHPATDDLAHPTRMSIWRRAEHERSFGTNMSKAAFIFLLAIGLLTMPGCKSTTAGVNIPGISGEEASKFLSADANLFRCGDRYFQVEGNSIDELKDPTFHIRKSEDLTQADSLNGVTWDALVELRAPSFRSSTRPETSQDKAKSAAMSSKYVTYGGTPPSGDGAQHWGDWQANYEPDQVRYQNEIRVKNGRIEPVPTHGEPFSCSNIPPG